MRGVVRLVLNRLDVQKWATFGFGLTGSYADFSAIQIEEPLILILIIESLRAICKTAALEQIGFYIAGVAWRSLVILI